MKIRNYLLSLLFPLLTCINSISAQTVDFILKKAMAKVNTIEFGHFHVYKYWKPFDYDNPKIESLEINFKLYQNRNKVNCTIEDSMDQTLKVFDGDVYKKTYSYKDSILNKTIAENPFSYWFEPIEPYFLEKQFSIKRKLILSQTTDLFILEEFTDFDTLDAYIHPHTIFKFRKSDYLPVYYSNTVDERQADGSLNTQVEYQLIDQFEFDRILNYGFIQPIENTLPVKQINFPLPLQISYSYRLDSSIRITNTLSADSNQLGAIIAGKKGIIFMTYLGCQPCKLALPMLEKLKDSLGIPIIAINIIDYQAIERIRKYIKINRMSIPYYISSDKKFKNIFDNVYPGFILYDENMMIMKTIKGFHPALQHEKINEIIHALKKKE